MKTKIYIPRIVEDYAFDETLTGRHMIFLAGPRQVGKSMLARNWLKEEGCSPLFFNWDDIATRQAYRADSRFFESPARMLGITDPWIVFDEIHKRNHWRDILKGVYDLFGNDSRDGSPAAVIDFWIFQDVAWGDVVFEPFTPCII